MEVDANSVIDKIHAFNEKTHIRGKYERQNFKLDLNYEMQKDEDVSA